MYANAPSSGIYDPNEDRDYCALQMIHLEEKLKTVSKLVLILLDKDGHPVTHVNGVEWEDAIRLAETYGSKK